jgi:hypothetical protein
MNVTEAITFTEPEHGSVGQMLHLLSGRKCQSGSENFTKTFKVLIAKCQGYRHDSARKFRRFL